MQRVLAACRYIVRCLCRIVYSAKASILPAVGVVLANVGKVLAKITKDPRQPTYNHYVFECLAALVRNVCGVNPASVTQFEAALFPSFNVRSTGAGRERLPACSLLLVLLCAPPPGHPCRSSWRRM